MSVEVRAYTPGDNLLSLDCVVNAQPFLRGIKACAHFADKKDGGDSYTCVRVAARGAQLVLSAANPLSMMVTSAQMVESAFSDAGVLDLPVWLVDQILAVFKNPTVDTQLRITARQGENKVKIAESTGLFDVNVHQWERLAMADTAPDVPVVISEVFDHGEQQELPQVLDSSTLHRVLQAAKVLQSEVVLDQCWSHYRFRFGAAGSAICVIPDYVRSAVEDDSSGCIDEAGELSVVDDGGDVRHLVRARPPEGMA